MDEDGKQILAIIIVHFVSFIGGVVIYVGNTLNACAIQQETILNGHKIKCQVVRDSDD
jgi:hypothetical protein